ncbi:hypothetical protein [Kineococcus sp. SYSU DK002]|uniref:hypothetical protein n=1 Tax=Kineococcus sp. SYSU DK002 TaxID=3383123 RepID=UPI003D7E5DF1
MTAPGAPTAAQALLLGRMSAEGEPLLASLPVGGGWIGGAGALAVGPARLWLAQPQLVGGPSTASVPVGDVGSASLRRRRFGALAVVLRLGGRDVLLPTRAAAGDVEEFLRALDAARGDAQRTTS